MKEHLGLSGFRNQIQGGLTPPVGHF